MLKLMNYEGCGNCEKRGSDFDCTAHTKQVEIAFLKPQFWDNCCGDMVVVFREGDKAKGFAVIDDNKVYCVTAESTVYKDVTDFVDLEDVEIIIII